MAFYLLIPPTTAAVRVVLGADISQTASGNFEIEFEVDIFGTNGIIAADNVGNGQNLIFFTTLTNLQLRIANSQRNFPLPQSAAGRHVYRIVSSTLSGNIQVFQDGVSCGTAAGNNFFAIGRIADLNNQAARHFGLYYLTVIDSANTLINHYNPSVSNGVGSTLIDTVGSNNGTLVNFPSDNSQWVLYDDGAGEDVSASIAVAMPQLSASVSAQSASPALSASVAMVMPQLSVIASGSSVAPDYTASASILMPQFAAAANASITAPGIVASVSVTMPQFSVNATGQQTLPDGGATVFFTMPQFAVSASGQQTVPEFSASIAATMPQFSVNASSSATEPGFVATVSYTMPQLSVAVQGETEAPNRTATVSVTMPNFSVSVIMADLVYGIAAGARSELPGFSRKSELVALSRRSVYNKLSTRSEWRQ